MKSEQVVKTKTEFVWQIFDKLTIIYIQYFDKGNICEQNLKRIWKDKVPFLTLLFSNSSVQNVNEMNQKNWVSSRKNIDGKDFNMLLYI